MNIRWLCFVLLLPAWGGVGRAAPVFADDRTIEIPFEFTHGAILVQATVNDRGPFTMMLDTGVDPSAIDLQVVEAAGLTLSADAGETTGTGSDKTMAHETELPVLKIGELEAEHVAALSADLSRLSEALGKPLKGVLGYSLLAGRIVQIDYPRRMVRFLKDAPAGQTGGAVDTSDGPRRTTVPFRYEDEILIDEVWVNGKRLTANLDTGSNSRFQLTPAAVTALGLEAEVAQGAVSRSLGFNGAAVNRRGKVGRVTIGKFAVGESEVVFYGKGAGYDESAWGIRIGNDFLKDYVVTIDYRSHTVTLERP